MNAITLQRDSEKSGAFVPTCGELPDSEAAAGEILVWVRAVSLNFGDLTVAGGDLG